MLAGLHLENDSRGDKLRLYESKESGAMVYKDPCVHVHKHTVSMGSGVCPSQIASGAFSGILTQMRMTRSNLRLFITVSDAFSVNLVQVIYVETHCSCNPHAYTCISQFCWLIWEFNLNFNLKFKGCISLSRGSEYPPPPSLMKPWLIYLT